jgi:hypothetical protein
MAPVEEGLRRDGWSVGISSIRKGQFTALHESRETSARIRGGVSHQMVGIRAIGCEHFNRMHAEGTRPVIRVPVAHESEITPRPGEDGDFEIWHVGRALSKGKVSNVTPKIGISVPQLPGKVSKVGTASLITL